jgi:hypothetical protein
LGDASDATLLFREMLHHLFYVLFYFVTVQS